MSSYPAWDIKVYVSQLDNYIMFNISALFTIKFDDATLQIILVENLDPPHKYWSKHNFKPDLRHPRNWFPHYPSDKILWLFPDVYHFFQDNVPDYSSTSKVLYLFMHTSPHEYDSTQIQMFDLGHVYLNKRLF